MTFNEPQIGNVRCLMGNTFMCLMDVKKILLSESSAVSRIRWVYGLDHQKLYMAVKCSQIPPGRLKFRPAVSL